MAKPLDEYNKFFKVYLPHYSSQQLDIPPAFVGCFRGTIPNNVVLKDHAGKSWLVELEEGESGLTIKNGWQCFVTDNSLEYGDFLVFHYDGKYLFDVEIFGRNGCKKGALSSNITASSTEIEVLDICSSPNHSLEQKCSKSAAKPVKNIAEASRYKLRRRARMHGEGKTLEEATDMNPKAPYFVRNIKRWSLSAVYFPKSLLDRNGIKIKQPEMVLVDQNGKEWPVVINIRNDGRVLINHGWSNFCKEYNLKIGDKCAFEFVLGRGNSCQKMRVQIIKKKSKDLKH